MEKKHMIEPDPAVKEHLMEAFDRMYAADRQPSAFRFSRLLNYPIPLYQVGLAASLLILVMFLFLLQSSRIVGTVAVADTVYIEKPEKPGDAIQPEQPTTPEPGTIESQSTPLPKEKVHHHDKQPQLDLAVNELYNRQLDDAVNRIPLITRLGQERSAQQDRELLKLVARVH